MEDQSFTERKKSPRINSAIVILHGWGSSPERWLEIKEQLNHPKIFIPYLPGFDLEKPLKKPYTIDDYAAWLKLYLKSNNLQTPVLIGHSNGGRIAVRYIATHNNASKLILIGSAGIRNTQPLFRFKKTVFKYLAHFGKNILKNLPNTKLAEKLLYKLAGESDYKNASPVMRKTMQNLLKYNIEKDLPDITCPTLCIWGKNDHSTPLWMGKLIHLRIPNSQLKILQCGHNPHREIPEELSKIINSFLSS